MPPTDLVVTAAPQVIGDGRCGYEGGGLGHLLWGSGLVEGGP